MSASVQGPEPQRAGPDPTSRRLIRVLALAVMLLVAAFATATARAQDAGTATEVPATQAPADPSPADATPAPAAAPDPSPPASPTSDQPAQPADQPPPPGDTTTAPDPAPADTGTGSPQGTEDHSASRQPTHSSDVGGGQSATAPASTTPSGGDTTTAATVAPSSDGYPGTWSGLDTFVVVHAKHSGTGGAGVFSRPRASLSGLLTLRAASRAGGLVVKARRAHAVAQAKPIGGAPGSGHQLPGQNPFFNLLSGPGGSAAGLVLASILAILGVAFVLPRDRSRRFRTPLVSWRPLAYVPPIELPG